jgi:hypothetical protein
VVEILSYLITERGTHAKVRAEEGGNGIGDGFAQLLLVINGR